MQLNLIFPLVLDRLLFLGDRAGCLILTLPHKARDTGLDRGVHGLLRPVHAVRALHFREHMLDPRVCVLLRFVAVLNGLRIHHRNPPVSVHRAFSGFRKCSLCEHCGHDHIQHGPCPPDPGRLKLIHPQLFISVLDAAHQAQPLHGTGHGHIQQTRILCNPRPLFTDGKRVFSIGIHNAVRPPTDDGQVQSQRRVLFPGRCQVHAEPPLRRALPYAFLQVHENHAGEFQALGLVHGHDPDIIFPDAHGGMIVTV